MITMQELEPLALCMATQNLFDKRFTSNFGDNIILRSRDSELEPRLLKIKREINSMMTEKLYLEGHKMNIINNIDRIMSLVPRYASIDLSEVEKVVNNSKELIKKVMACDSFDEIGTMEATFKSQILLPVYGLYVKKSKKDQ